MAGFDRYANLLQLFSEDRSHWSVAELAAALDLPVSTIYRTVRELVGAGFIESTVDARYRLGPAIVEFDRRIRLTDPLIRSGAVFLEPMVEQADVPVTAVLARLYGDRVMCVADARSPQFRTVTSFQRGRPMPILRGATSKAILAAMAPRRREKLVAQLGAAASADLAAMAAELDTIRRTGISLTRGEVDSGLIGIAAPVQHKGFGIHASATFILAASDSSDAVQARLCSLLASNARLIEAFMEEAYSALPPQQESNALKSSELSQ